MKKWLNIWVVWYNPTGYGKVPYYFDTHEEAMKFSQRDYADTPKRIAKPTDNEPHPITVYKTAENADKDNGHTVFI